MLIDKHSVHIIIKKNNVGYIRDKNNVIYVSGYRVDTAQII